MKTKIKDSGWFSKILDGYTSIDYELEAEEKAYKIADEFAIKLFASSDLTVRQSHSVYVDVKKIIYKNLIETYESRAIDKQNNI